jgi:hypothetical protein
MHYTYLYRYLCTCVRDGYGLACGCTACDAHARAIARADDAAVSITCACGYVRRHIWPTHTSCININIYPDERIAGAGPPHTLAHVRAGSERARVCVCDWAPTHPRRTVRAPSAGVDRGWPRLAGVLRRVCVQREHRRVEHRKCQKVVHGMRRLSGPGGAPPRAGRARPGRDAARAVVRGGTADARARVCAQTCVHAHARVCTCVGIAARSKDGISVFMYLYVFICNRYMYVRVCKWVRARVFLRKRAIVCGR